MPVSLYAHGTAVIEVGKYGMNLNDAKNSFLETAKNIGLPDPKIKESKNSIVINFRSLHSKLHDLLSAVADVEDLHGDPPDSYSLKGKQDIPAGEYIKTGTYND